MPIPCFQESEPCRFWLVNPALHKLVRRIAADRKVKAEHIWIAYNLSELLQALLMLLTLPSSAVLYLNLTKSSLAIVLVAVRVVSADFSRSEVRCKAHAEYISLRWLHAVLRDSVCINGCHRLWSSSTTITIRAPRI